LTVMTQTRPNALSHVIEPCSMPAGAKDFSHTG
jgi:hypothetical protein